MATNIELAELMGALSTSGKTNAEIVIDAYELLFNRLPDTDGANYWTDRLDNGLAVTDLKLALLNGVRFYDGEFNDKAIADLALRSSKAAVADAIIEAGEAITAEEAAAMLADVVDTTTRDAALTEVETIVAAAGGEEPGDGENPTTGTTDSLTTKADMVDGTSNDDTFYAFVQQNEAGTGGIANALSTGDVVDGGAGNDMLDATLIGDETVNDATNFSVMPVITDVEEIRVQALENSATGVDGDESLVILDADRTTGEDHFASDRSRADLVIDNVNLDSDQITKDITIEMKDTQQNSDLAVYFNEIDLKAAPDSVAASAEFYIQVADGNAQDSTKPLDNIKFDLDFSQGETTYEFTDLSPLDGTYSGLVTTIEAALAAAGLTRYEVSLGNEFTEFETDSGTVFPLDDYTGNYVTITDTEGEEFDEVNFTPSQKSGTTLAIILAQSEVDAAETVTTSVVESDIILDGVGRGSNGGELVVGSTSDSASSTGIDTFNIEVRESSVIHDISTTNDAMNEINITNGEGYTGDFVLTNAAYTEGDIEIYGNVDNTSFKEGLSEMNITAFTGDVTLGRDNDIENLFSLSASIVGDVTLNADYDSNAYGSDSQSFSVVTGTGSDDITASLVGTSTSGSTQASLLVNAGNGNNTVTLSSDDTEANTAEVTTGTGIDTVTGGATHLDVSTGSGNDVIYTENTGAKVVAELAAGASIWAAAVNVVNSGADAYAMTYAEFLNGRTVQITVAVPEDAGSVDADSFIDGYELTATVEASEGVLTTELDLYNTVVDAINADPMINKLVTASIDSNDQITITYLIDGNVALADGMVQFEILDDDYADLSSSDKAALQDAIEEKFNDSDITAASIEAAYDGADSDLGAGFELIQAVENGTAAVYTIDLTGLVAAAAGAVTLDFTLNGNTTTWTEGVDFTGGANEAAIAANLETAATIDINGVTYDIAQVGATAEITLTQQVPTTATGGTISITDDQPATVTGTQTTDGVTTTLGTDATTGGDNTVNAGAGDDVIVLSSNDAQVDTVEFNASTNNGNDMLVNFEVGAGGDIFDFSAWLDNTQYAANTASTSDISEQRVDGTTAAINAIIENSVAVTNMSTIDDNDAGLATALDFDTMTDAQVLDEIIASAVEFDAGANSATLVGTELKAILMIEDSNQNVVTDSNLGHYKVYEVTYDTDGAVDEFTGVELIGTIDTADTLGALDDTNIA